MKYLQYESVILKISQKWRVYALLVGVLIIAVLLL
jgi:hypothetical protein